MTASTIRNVTDETQRLRAEVKRQRSFVESLCLQVFVDLEAVREAEPARADQLIERLQADLRMLVDTERLRAGDVQLKREVFDLHPVARIAVARQAFTAHELGVGLRCFVHKDAPRRVVGDRDRLAALLGELVANAVPLADGGGVYVFVAPETSASDETMVRFTICDRKEGPPASLRPAGVVPARSQVTTAPWYGAARDLVRRMGGDIGCHASAEGVALWFTIALDTKMPRPERNDLSAQAPVLLVTSHPQRAAAVTSALQNVGILVEVETNEQKVPIRLEEANYSVVLMDGENGVPATSLAVRVPETQEIRTTPVAGVPRCWGQRELVDESALLRVVQRLSRPRS